jgi:hypothetical protein
MAGADVDIGVTDAAGEERHQHLPRSWLRDGQLRRFQRLA